MALPSSALPGLILDLDDYSESTDAYDQQAVKAVHAYQSPQVTITGGISQTKFTVGLSDVSKFSVGFPVVVHDYSYSAESPETTIAGVDTGTGTITTTDSLGFVPASGYFCSLLGFADGSASYRWV